MNSESIINRVESSGLISFDLENLYDDRERVLFDVKDLLYQDMVLRENDFRAFVKDHNWQNYLDKNVAVFCSSEAIIPTWAYMLLISKLESFAHVVMVGNLETLEIYLFQRALNELDLEQFRGGKLVIKGCSDKPVPDFAYAEFTRMVKPIASSIMFGEPCSTVPVYKKPKNTI